MATGNGNYPLTENKKQEMVRLYQEGMPIRHIAKELNVNASTVHRNLNKMGVKEVDVTKRKASAHRLTEESKALIVEMYKRGDRVEDIMKTVGCSRPTVYIHVENAGLKGSRDFTEEQVNEAIQLYIDGQLTMTQIVRETGMSKATIYRRLKKYIEEQEG
jgi:transposase-like protein